MLAEAVASQAHDHAPYGGVVPEIAARAHAERLDGAIADVMARAGLAFADLDVVAATAGPGLVGGVMAGLSMAKGIALAADTPLIAVNHLEAHVLSPRLTAPLAFPFLVLLVSGGHTQLLVAKDVGAYARLGATRDDAAGEAFDKTAKLLGAPPPGGPAIEALAKRGDPARFTIPRPFRGAQHCDFSFAGLKTAALRIWETSAQSDQDRADLAAAVQAAIADVLADRTARAAALAKAQGASALAIVGGVAANATVRTELQRVAEACDLTIAAPPLKWCTDNAAMVALAGAERYHRGLIDDWTVAARARWPLDAHAAASAPVLGSGRKGPKA